jgi:hypothetical protein
VDPRDPSIRWKFTGPAVSIPLCKVFSVRQYANNNHVTGERAALPKTFEAVLPHVQHMKNWSHGPVFAVDDTPGAWDPSDRRWVFHIPRFSAQHNTPDDLLYVAWLIERATEHFFTYILWRLAQLPPQPVPTWSEPTDAMAVGSSVEVLREDVQFFSKDGEPAGKYAVWSKPGETPMVWNCATRQRLPQVTASREAFEAFLHTLIPDIPCNNTTVKGAIRQCPTLADWIHAVRTARPGQVPTVPGFPPMEAPVAAAPVAAAPAVPRPIQIPAPEAGHAVPLGAQTPRAAKCIVCEDRVHYSPDPEFCATCNAYLVSMSAPAVEEA